MVRFCRFALVTAAAVATGMHVPALTAQTEGPVPSRVLVRAEAKNGPAVLGAFDVSIELAGQKVALSSFHSLGASTGLSGSGAGQPLEIAVLIDDGLRGNFDTNLKELEQFVGDSANANAAVGVGYMRNGSAYFPQGFSHDPEVVRKAVRVPISVAGIDGSPYFCLEDLVKHWPTHTGAARVVLMITNGIDRYNGSVSPLNQDSPYVDEAIRSAQRAAVPVYSIFYGRRGINSGPGSFSGQSYLGKVADETGGVLFNQGTLNPPSLTPYFRQFTQDVGNTYDAEFTSAVRKLERLKVSTTVPGVKLHTQHEAQAGNVGGSGAPGE